MATENVKVFCVYKHTSPSEKIYIGQTKRNPKLRWKNGEGYKHNQHFYNAIQKYGWDNFKHEIVCSDLTDKEADWLEKYLISYYNSSNRNYGYNIEGGGNNNKIISDETKSKQSKAHIGQVSGMKGKKQSDEAKEKISVAHKGKHKTEEWKENMKNKMLQIWIERKENDWKMPESAKEKISVARKGKPSSHRKPIKINDIVYNSLSSAAKALNISASHLCGIIKGKKNNILNLKIELIWNRCEL